MAWQPSAGFEALKKRAELYAQIRNFFAERAVLEVETPLLCIAGVTDPSIEPLIVETSRSDSAPRYLQTSPEYAMKRLLAQHRQPIFQISKAFRDGEAGKRHNPEFTLLEWYRPGLDDRALMDEVQELLCLCVGERSRKDYSYRDLFIEHLELDPFTIQDTALERAARARLDVGDLSADRNVWLDLLMTHVIEPRLHSPGLCFIYDYPASQAALAQVHEVGGVKMARRFECYLDGLELANGYLELKDVQEQRLRFEADNMRRDQCGQQQLPIDEHILAALEYGLPTCSGVAMGLDRLLMLALGCDDIRQVVAFDWTRA